LRRWGTSPSTSRTSAWQLRRTVRSETTPPARQEIEKFFYAQRAHAEHVIEGLRKAGLEIPKNAPIVETAVTSAGGSGPMPADQGT
jgi:hypothetical protein